jgi:hypothetical protein
MELFFLHMEKVNEHVVCANFLCSMKQVNNEECAIDMIMNKSSRNDTC